MASALGAAALGGLGLLRSQRPRARAPRPPAAPRPRRRRARAASLPAAAAEDSIFPDLDPLPGLEPSSSGSSPDEFRVDVAVAGAGPAGLAVAARVAAAGFSVAVVDPAPLAAWPNNYGVWCDEFEAMGLEDCFATVWQSAVVHLDVGPLGARTLTRPYARVDRPRLKRRLLADCLAAGVRFHVARVEGGAAHAAGRSTLSCRAAGGGEGALTTVVASLVVDATGHARRLVQHDGAYDPGYQGAYGFTAEVESHPFDPAAMLFMDWRDEHLAALPELRASNAKLPTFLYAMPFSPTRIFLEETSLVARPIVPFPELKARLEARLKHLGIVVKSIEDEEYCAIPMGGALPRLPQRVVAVGGTAGQVHPSTGYMIARVLGAAPAAADAIIDALSSPGDKAENAGAARAPRGEAEADAMAAAVWAAVWPRARLRQREFFVFGMEVLLKLNLAETRQFFAAFFALSDHHWRGFLSARLSLPELIGFGLSLFARSTNAARADLVAKGLPGLAVMLARLAKTLR